MAETKETRISYFIESDLANKEFLPTNDFVNELKSVVAEIICRFEKLELLYYIQRVQIALEDWKKKKEEFFKINNGPFMKKKRTIVVKMKSKSEKTRHFRIPFSEELPFEKSIDVAKKFRELFVKERVLDETLHILFEQCSLVQEKLTCKPILYALTYAFNFEDYEEEENEIWIV